MTCRGPLLPPVAGDVAGVVPVLRPMRASMPGGLPPGRLVMHPPGGLLHAALATRARHITVMPTVLPA